MQHPGNEQVLHVSKPSNTLGGLDFYQPRCAGRNDEPPPIRKYIVLQLLQAGGIFSVQLKDHSPGPQTGKDRWLRCLSSSVCLSEYKEPQTSWDVIIFHQLPVSIAILLDLTGIRYLPLSDLRLSPKAIERFRGSGHGVHLDRYSGAGPRPVHGP